MRAARDGGWCVGRWCRGPQVTNQKLFSEEVHGFLSNVKIGSKTLGEVSKHARLW